MTPEFKSNSAADPSSRAPVCPRCGYDLRGIPEDTCPECGFGYQNRAIENLAMYDAAEVEARYDGAIRWAAAASVLAYPLTALLAGLLFVLAFVRPAMREVALGLASLMFILGVPAALFLTRFGPRSTRSFVLLAALACYAFAVFRLFLQRPEYPYLDRMLTDRISSTLRIKRFFAWAMAAIATVAFLLRYVLPL